MKKISGAALILFTAIIILSSCNIPTLLSGMPKDKINPVADASFSEPAYINYPVTRLLYAQLGSNEQLMYRHIYNTVFSHPEFIALSPGADEDSIKKIITYLKYDNPHLLCFSSSFKLVSVGSSLFLCPIYTCSADECQKRTAELFECAQKTVEAAGKNSDDFEKELFIHDTLAEHCSYNASITNSNAYDALIKGQSACGGYALAMKLMLDMCSVSSSAVSGTVNDSGAHMWLCVKINGEWYHLDPTWDDPVGSPDGKAVHAWFNVPSSDINSTHTGYTLPKNVRCDSCTQNYYTRMDLTANGMQAERIISAAVQNAYRSGRNFIELKFDSGQSLSNAVTALCEEGGISQYAASAGYAQNGSFSYTENKELNLLYIYFSEK